MIRLSSLPITYFRRPQSDLRFLYNRLLPIGLVIGTILASIGLAYVLVDISLTFAVLGVVAIPAGILLTTRPYFGLLLVVFALPFEEFNKFGNGSLSVLKLLSIAVFGGAVIHFLIFRRKDSLVGAPQNWLISFLLLAIVLSNFVAIDPSRTLEKTIKLLRILALYVVVINIIRSKMELKGLLWVFLIAGFLSTLYSMFDPEQAGRFTGTMNDPNVFAMEMGIRLPLALGFLRVEKGRLKQVSLLIIIGVLCYGVISSGSRGGLMATGLSLLTFAFLQKKRIAWLVLVGLIAWVSITAMPLEMKKRVGLVEADTGENLGNSTDRRETYQIYGWQLWQQNPILGIGLDGFADAFGRSEEYRFLQTTQHGRVAHNTYLEILVGIGLLGMIPFISLLILSLFKTWKYANNNRDPDLAGISASLFASQAGFFLGILFLSQQYSKVLWLLIALVVVLHHLMNMAEGQQLSLAVKRQ